MDWVHIAEQSLASAPGVLILAGMFGRQIRALRRADQRYAEALAAITRRVDRLCDRFGVQRKQDDEEVTGRHSVVPPRMEG